MGNVGAEVQVRIGLIPERATRQHLSPPTRKEKREQTQQLSVNKKERFDRLDNNIGRRLPHRH